MDARWLEYYERELEHLRSVGAEFAAEFPKIAGRLGLDATDCSDPYVERLLEGFAFLAARTQLKVDSEYPQFTHHLFEMVMPNYLAPTPSMAILQLLPKLSEGTIAEGYLVQRGQRIRASSRNISTRCDFVTAHDVTLWPLELNSAVYAERGADSVAVSYASEARASLRLRLHATAGKTIAELPIDSLPVYLGNTVRSQWLYQQILSQCVGVVVSDPDASASQSVVLDASCVERMGFSETEALLPNGPRSFSGYRLLQEYFAMPERFLFVNFRGLREALSKCDGDKVDLIVLFDRSERSLENKVTSEELGLFCTPAINLFPKQADRVHVNSRLPEYHVVPDRSKTLDYEVFRVTEVSGYGNDPIDDQPFLPFYQSEPVSGNIADRAQQAGAYFTQQRRNRVSSSTSGRPGLRTDYRGSEMFVSLVDSGETPYRHDLRQLGIATLCTNRDVPLLLGDANYSLESGAPIDSVICRCGPTRPRESAMNDDGSYAWRLVNHLSLNYLSLVEEHSGRGATALRDLLRLYCDPADRGIETMINGLTAVSANRVTRCVSEGWPIVHARGLEVTLTIDEMSFRGVSSYLFGMILSEFLTRFVSINSFVETVLCSEGRGELSRWPAKHGSRHLA